MNAMTLTNARRVVDCAYGWAESPKRRVCSGVYSDGRCPTDDGQYCCDCHVTAYNAAMYIRAHCFEWIRAFFGHPNNEWSET